MSVDTRLQDHRTVWDIKPVLREIYGDYHKSILVALGENGPILDIGAGSGHFRSMSDQVISLDILSAPWVDVVGDAEALPFADASISGIAMLDVLHHLPSPMSFFNEAKRVLKPGGRIAMIEPGITPLSWLFFNFLHQEDVDMSVDPMADQTAIVADDPFASNQGLPTLLFARDRHRKRFAAALPELSITQRRWLSLWAYPLSGGFKRWSLIPTVSVAPLLAVEKIMLPILGPLMGFRLAVVLERS